MTIPPLFNRQNSDLLFFALLAVLLEVIPTLFGGYGYFIDEWYYIACAKHLAFGYVDHPPLAPLLLRGVLWIAGGSLVAIRLLPALAGGATVYLTGLIVRELNGGKFAIAIACLSTIVAPAFLVIFGFFSVNAFEVLTWVLCWYLLVRFLKGEEFRYWLLFGLALGVGLETKHTIVLLAMAVAAGILLTPARRNFLRAKFWLGWAIAFVLVLPNLLWQVAHGWPSLEFYANATVYKNIPTPPLQLLLGQLVLQNPVTLIVWGSGLVFALVLVRGRQYRPIGWAYLVLLGLMILSRSSRPDRIAGAYPILFAAGGVLIESVLQRWKIAWARPALLGLIALGGVGLAPIGLPVLSPEALARYSAALGIVPPIEKGKSSELPQWFADRFDWDELVSTVAYVYHHLPAEERKRAAIFAPSYGHAGALEFYSAEFGLPRVICNHNNYYFWGMGKASSDVLIAIDGGASRWRRVYGRVDSVAVIRGTYAMSWRVNMPVYIARDPTTPLDSVWFKIRHFE